MKKSRKETAIALRKAGYSYSYISAETRLAKSTLSHHLADIVYTPNLHMQKTLRSASLRSAETKHQQKQQRMLLARTQAEKEFGIFSKRDTFIAGVALYAGEGSKTQNLVRLVNADERVIHFFIKWLLLLGVPRSHILLRVHGYPDTDKVEAESFWQKETSLPKNQLQPMCIDTRVNKDRKRSNTHPHGTAHITVRANGNPEFGAMLARKIAVYMELLLG